jgi:uncharacterized protein (TIGR02271 family)
MHEGLTPLSGLRDYEVAEGYPDIRGWTLRDENGADIGEVQDLLVDTSRGEALYATIDFEDESWLRGLVDQRADARIPLWATSIDKDDEAVRLTQPLATLVGAGGGWPETGTEPVGGMRPTGGEYEDATRGGESDVIDVIEERADVAKRRQKAGELRIGKEIERQTVRRQVPVEREEAIVERETVDRPVAPEEAERHLGGPGGEIRIPLYGEEVEITKRPVVAERLRIRKRAVEDVREVAAEVRRERARVEGEGAVEERPAGRDEGWPGRDRTR